MKNKKLFKILKNNWFFVLLCIPFIFFCIINCEVDNDIWFLLNNGRYVLNHGIPHIDPFTIHSGLHYVMQQWLSSVIFYSVFKIFGSHGLFFLVIMLYLLLSFVLYKLYYYVSGNKFQTIIIILLIFNLSKGFIVTRPQVFTYIILLLETLILEKYSKDYNIKRLFYLPLLSFLLINLHASMWFLQFVFILPFIVSLYLKKKEKVRYLLLISLFMFLVGFINPYGIEAITYIFKSYGFSIVNKNIYEMMTPSFDNKLWLISIILLFSYFLLIYYNKKKVDIRFILSFGLVMLFLVFILNMIK